MKSWLHLFHDNHAGSSRSTQKDSHKFRTPKADRSLKQDVDDRNNKYSIHDRQDKQADAPPQSRPPDASKFTALLGFTNSISSTRHNTVRNKEHKRSKTTTILQSDIPIPPLHNGVGIQPANLVSKSFSQVQGAKVVHQHARSLSDSQMHPGNQGLPNSALTTKESGRGRGVKQSEKPRPLDVQLGEGTANGDSKQDDRRAVLNIDSQPNHRAEVAQDRIIVERSGVRVQPRVEDVIASKEKQRMPEENRHAGIGGERPNLLERDRRRKENDADTRREGERDKRRHRKRDTENERDRARQTMKEQNIAAVRTKDGREDKAVERVLALEQAIPEVPLRARSDLDRDRDSSDKDRETTRRQIKDRERRDSADTKQRKAERKVAKDKDRRESRQDRLQDRKGYPIERSLDQKRALANDSVDKLSIDYFAKAPSANDGHFSGRMDVTQPVSTAGSRVGRVEDPRGQSTRSERDARRNYIEDPRLNTKNGHPVDTLLPLGDATLIRVQGSHTTYERDPRDNYQKRSKSHANHSTSAGVATSSGSAKFPMQSAGEFVQPADVEQPVNTQVNAAQVPSDPNGTHGTFRVYIPSGAINVDKTIATPTAPVHTSASTTRHTPTTVSGSPLASLHSSTHTHGEHLPSQLSTPSRQAQETSRTASRPSTATRAADPPRQEALPEHHVHTSGSHARVLPGIAGSEPHSGQARGRGSMDNGHPSMHTSNGQAGSWAMPVVGSIDGKSANNINFSKQVKHTSKETIDASSAMFPPSQGSREPSGSSRQASKAFINVSELRPSAALPLGAGHQTSEPMLTRPHDGGNSSRPSPEIPVPRVLEKGQLSAPSGEKQSSTLKDNLPSHISHSYSPHTLTTTDRPTPAGQLNHRLSLASLTPQPHFPQPHFPQPHPISNNSVHAHQSQNYVTLLERPPPGVSDLVQASIPLHTNNASDVSRGKSHVSAKDPMIIQTKWTPPGGVTVQQPPTPLVSSTAFEKSNSRADKRTSVQLLHTPSGHKSTTPEVVPVEVVDQPVPKAARLNIHHKGLADILFSPNVTVPTEAVPNDRRHDKYAERNNTLAASLVGVKGTATPRLHEKSSPGRGVQLAEDPGFSNHEQVTHPSPANQPHNGWTAPTKQASDAHPSYPTQVIDNKAKTSPISTQNDAAVWRFPPDHVESPTTPMRAHHRNDDLGLLPQAYPTVVQPPLIWQPPPETYSDRITRSQHAKTQSMSHPPQTEAPRKRDRRTSYSNTGSRPERSPERSKQQPVTHPEARDSPAGTSFPPPMHQGAKSVQSLIAMPPTSKPSPRVDDTRAPPPTPILVPSTSMSSFPPVTRVISVDSALPSSSTLAQLSLQVNPSLVSLPADLSGHKSKGRLFSNILPGFSSRSKPSNEGQGPDPSQSEPDAPSKSKRVPSRSASKLRKDRDKGKGRDRDREDRHPYPAKAIDGPLKVDHIVYTPFKYLVPKKKWSMSAASLEVRDGISTNATTIIGSPTTSVLSQNLVFQPPPLRDPLRAAREWREAAELRRLPGGKIKRHPPGVTFIDVDDEPPSRMAASRPSRSKKHAR